MDEHRRPGAQGGIGQVPVSGDDAVRQDAVVGEPAALLVELRAEFVVAASGPGGNAAECNTRMVDPAADQARAVAVDGSSKCPRADPW